MRKFVGAILAVALLIAVFGGNVAVASSLVDDWMYQIVYNALAQAAEEAGYTNYEIIIDDDYSATINILDAPTPTETPVEEDPVQEEEQKVESKETEPEEKLSSEEELTLGLQELEQENIIDAMQHFLRALPSEKAEKLIAENAYDYVDELMFAEDYQNAQVFMIEHPFDGCEQLLAECNDHCFLVDLGKALNARWKISDEDTSIWSDKKVREWYQQLVECETQYLDKYVTLGFSDAQLANYAYAYIGALQSQSTGAAYYGVDNEKFNENWSDHGRYVRSRLIYLINRKYGIEIDSSLSKDLKEMVNEGINLDYVYAVTESMTEQLSTMDFALEKATTDRVMIKKFDLKNTSGYDIPWYVQIDLVLLDEKGQAIGTIRQMFDLQSIEDGQNFIWNYSEEGSLIYEDAFASMCFKCNIPDLYDDSHIITVYPSKRYAWDGKEIIIDGYKESSRAGESILIEESDAYWTEYNGGFAPCTEFILRNNGESDLKEAIIECVFINKEDNTEWSREKYFAISSSDSPLHFGQGRSVIVYSGKGYEKKTRKVANLEVEIYVNDKPIAKYDVTRP